MAQYTLYPTFKDSPLKVIKATCVTGLGRVLATLKVAELRPKMTREMSSPPVSGSVVMTAQKASAVWSGPVRFQRMVTEPPVVVESVGKAAKTDQLLLWLLFVCGCCLFVVVVCLW
jgi:hypothetical protein